MAKKRFMLTINPEHEEWLEKMSKESGLTVPAIIRLLITRAIVTKEKFI